MPIAGVSTMSTSQNTTTAAGMNQLGQEEFLKILIAQLSYQDPLNPMDDRDFIAQMAQFSSLEQMMQMNKAIENMANSIGMGDLATQSQLIGHKVFWGESSSGTVDSVLYSDGVLYLEMKDGQRAEAIWIDRVEKVGVEDEPANQ